jgi:hypothetical protein
MFHKPQYFTLGKRDKPQSVVWCYTAVFCNCPVVKLFSYTYNQWYSYLRKKIALQVTIFLKIKNIKGSLFRLDIGMGPGLKV